jgi:SNF2 family DNA or RNA helicase
LCRITTYRTLVKSYAPGKKPVPTGNDEVDEAALDEYNERANQCRDALHVEYWDRVVLDETHNIKDHLTAVANAAFHVYYNTGLFISGTPLVDKPIESFSLLVMLGSENQKEYRTWKLKNFKNGATKKMLAEQLQRCMIRRMKTDRFLGKPLVKLPKVTIRDVHVGSAAVFGS